MKQTQFWITVLSLRDIRYFEAFQNVTFITSAHILPAASITK